jgi:hypothetical protein
MNQYICLKCKKFQYTANPCASGEKCIYCDGKVALVSEGVRDDEREDKK